MAKTPNAATTPAPRVTKMAQARTLYATIVAKPAPEGKSHRGLFIESAVSSGLLPSDKAANTYFQNIKNSPEAPTPSAPVAQGLRDELKAIGTQMTELNKRVNDIAKRVA